MAKITAEQLSISSSNHIMIDGEWTDYRVIQRKGRTVIYKGQLAYGVEPKGINLPHAQYSMSFDGTTQAGTPGRVQFYTDVKAALEKEKASA